MKKKPRIGYFGGTFDPPHLGHLVLAAEAFHQLKLDQLNWILTPDPPHKTDRQITPVRLRLEMINLIVDSRSEFRVNCVDLNRDPPHYAADTVEILREEDPGQDLVYIIGEDSLQDLPDWHQPVRFLTAVDTLAIAPRPGITTDLADLERGLPELVGKTIWIEHVRIEISSSTIRSRIRSLKPYQHFLPEVIAGYIKKHHLYL